MIVDLPMSKKAPGGTQNYRTNKYRDTKNLQNITKTNKIHP